MNRDNSLLNSARCQLIVAARAILSGELGCLAKVQATVVNAIVVVGGAVCTNSARPNFVERDACIVLLLRAAEALEPKASEAQVQSAVRLANQALRCFVRIDR